MKKIEIKNVSFSYPDSENKKRIKALDGVSLDVNEGEFVGIIGRNGSGKSTLAKMLNGIIIPDEGEILVDGMNTKDPEMIWKIRQKAGMIFQNPDNQMVATIVEEDIAFGPENLGVDPEEIRERVDKALLTVNMEKYRAKKPHELSGGQKQRIAIAGILAMHPECIIFDEPTAMLDPKGRMEVLNTIKLLNSRGVTIILITHYMEEVAEADRVVILNSGKKEFDGKPEEVFTNAKRLEEMMLEPPFATKMASRLKAEGIIERADILTMDQLVDELCQ